MPNALLPVPMVEESVVRPSIIEVAKQIIDATMGPTDLKIVFQGQQETILQPGSSIHENRNNNTELASKNTLYIESIEKYDEIYAGQLAAFQREQVAIFVDNDIGVTIRPNYVPKTVELSFTLKHESKTQINAWRDSIYLHINRLRSVYLHELTYHFGLPENMIKILKKIHELKENVAGYGEDWETYFQSRMTDRATIITNQVGEHASWAVREKRRRVQGLFDFTDAPAVPDKTDANIWQTTFSYSFTMDVPVSMSMVYPAMVHNQLMPMNYLDVNTQSDTNYKKSYPRSLALMSFFEAPQELARLTSHRPQPIVLPEFDDFKPDNKPHDHFTILQVLCELAEDRKEMFCLQHLGDVEINDKIIAFLKDPALQEWKYLTTLNKSIFFLSRYEFAYVKDNDNPMQVDQDLNIRMTEPLDPRKNHRIRLVMNTRLNSMDSAAIRRLAKHPDALRAWGAAVNLTWDQIMWYTPKVDLRAHFPHLKPKVDRYPSRHQVHLAQTQFNTVQTSFVIARRMNTEHDTQDHWSLGYLRKHVRTP